MPVQHVFIIGAKGLGNYGGYETFVDRLTEEHQFKKTIQYHVACKYNGQGTMDERKLIGAKTIDDFHFEYHNADCYKIKVPEWMGSAQALFYDVQAVKEAIKYCKKNHINEPIVYILACRIGPWIDRLKKQIHDMDGKVYINPDGHEWLRAKWSPIVRKYWKTSERLMVKHADLLICDSINIEKYIQEEYSQYHPETIYISYGADIQPSTLPDNDPKYIGWLEEHKLRPYNYYLIVGRFVPENNFETMIREFMKSHSKKSLAIVTTRDDGFLNALDEKLHFKLDERIKFVGTVYDQELLKKIRENAYGYLHGHSVGGTNPSLLEALGSTKINLLYDVGFNREVGRDAALYWNKEAGNLSNLINNVDLFNKQEIDNLSAKGKKIVSSFYSWEYIANRYENLWTNNNNRG